MDRSTLARAHRHGFGPIGRIAWLIAAAAAPFAMLMAVVSPVLVLPIFCLLTLTMAGIVSLAAHAVGAPSNCDRVTVWDIAGGFALIGFAAGIFSEPAHVIRLFEIGAATR